VDDFAETTEEKPTIRQSNDSEIPLEDDFADAVDGTIVETWLLAVLEIAEDKPEVEWGTALKNDDLTRLLGLLVVR
jgi:hypothetical protein